MSEELHPDKLTGIVRDAVHSVFSTMLALPLTDKPAFQEAPADPPDSYDGVEALVGIGGPWTGTGRICCSSKFACTLAGALLMTPYESLNEDVLDAVAEVANMVIGNIKTSLEETLGALALSIPTVIFGRNYRTRSTGINSWLVVPFECDGTQWQVRFCLIPSRAPSHAAHSTAHHRVELVQQ